MIVVAKPRNIRFLRPLRDLGFELKKPREIRNKDVGILIRYGSAVKTNAEIEINNAKGILLSGNKARARKLFIEKEIPTPKLIEPNEYKEDITIVGRPEKHSKGQGFYLIHNIDELNNAWENGARYFSEYIEKNKEYRVHVAHGKVLLAQEKIPYDERDRILPIWNWATGRFVFRVIKWSSIPRGLLPLAVRVAETLKLDFAAVDIMEKDGKFYVLESNTAPRLMGYTLEKYMRYFKWLKDNPDSRHFENVKRYIIREEDYANSQV